jgi:uncharacterized membrane protein
MGNTYLWLKTLHVLGTILFLGNVIVTAWWKLAADRTRNPLVIRFVHRQVIHTDILFTATGAAILAITGGANTGSHAGPVSSNWINVGSALFTATGAVWLFLLIPVQVAQSKITRTFEQYSVVPERYWFLARLWGMFGLIATVLPLMALYWMIFKPA